MTRAHILVVALFVLLAYFLVGSNITSDRTTFADEYVFAKLSQNLPDYSTNAAWIPERFLMEPPAWWPEGVYENAYSTPIWVHPPLANILARPLLRVLDPIEDIKTLRFVPLVFYLAVVALFVDIIRRRWGLAASAISLLPLLLCSHLIYGGLWFYNDPFMWMLFALSLWLIEVKPNSKWKYLTMTALVLTKLNAVILLVPLALAYFFKSGYKKAAFTLLPALALAPYLIWTWTATGDILYLWHHWQTMRVIGSGNLVNEVLPNLNAWFVDWGLYPFLILTVPGFCYACSQRQYLPFALFYLITLAFGFGWGFIEYHVFAIMLSGMFMAAATFNLIQHKGALECVQH